MDSRLKFASLAITAAFALAACNLFGSSSPQPRDDENSSPERGEFRWLDSLEVASGNAYRGPWRMNESDFHYVDDPDVALATDRTAVVWVDNERQDVFLQVFDDDQPLFDDPTNVSRSPNVFSWLPRVEFADDGETVYVLWQEIAFTGGSHGGEILFARSTDGGNTFDSPINLSNTTAGAGKGRTSPERWHNGSLDLAIGADGDIYTAWTEYEGPLRVSRSTDGGQSFDEPIHVAGDESDPTRAPSLATGPDETVYLAMTFGERRDADIYIARSTDGGQSFDEPRRAVDTSAHSDSPSIAVDDDHTLHLAMADSDQAQPQRYRVYYTRSTDRAESFEDLRELSDIEGQSSYGANFPSLELDADANPWVLWEHFPDYRHRPVGLKLTRSTDGGDSFESPFTVPGSTDSALGISGGLQGLLMDKFAIGDDGRLAIAHSHFQEGQHSLIQLFLGEIHP